eukprot:s3135_g7.t1
MKDSTENSCRTLDVSSVDSGPSSKLFAKSPMQLPPQSERSSCNPSKAVPGYKIRVHGNLGGLRSGGNRLLGTLPDIEAAATCKRVNQAKPIVIDLDDDEAEGTQPRRMQSRARALAIPWLTRMSPLRSTSSFKSLSHPMKRRKIQAV